jgi:hypothetical protein
VQQWFQKCQVVVDPNGGPLSSTFTACHTDTTAVGIVIAAGLLAVALVVVALIYRDVQIRRKAPPSAG